MAGSSSASSSGQGASKTPKCSSWDSKYIRPERGKGEQRAKSLHNYLEFPPHLWFRSTWKRNLRDDLRTKVKDILQIWQHASNQSASMRKRKTHPKPKKWRKQKLRSRFEQQWGGAKSPKAHTHSHCQIWSLRAADHLHWDAQSQRFPQSWSTGCLFHCPVHLFPNHTLHILNWSTHYQTKYGDSFIQTLFLVQTQSQTQREKPSSLCTELISFGDWVTRILFLCIHTHVNKMGVKHTEHKYHLQLLGACQHRHNTIHSRAIHLCSSYLYKKLQSLSHAIPTLIFLSSENVTKIFW